MANEVSREASRARLLSLEIEQHIGRCGKWRRRGVANCAEGKHRNVSRSAGTPDPFCLHIDRRGAVIADKAGPFRLAFDHSINSYKFSDATDDDVTGADQELGIRKVFRQEKITRT
jgi:hypothetical protein